LANLFDKLELSIKANLFFDTLELSVKKGKHSMRNHEFGHTLGEIQRQQAEKYTSIHSGGGGAGVMKV